MALFTDSDIYLALKRLFATTFFDDKLANSKCVPVDYTFVAARANQEKDWRILFNHLHYDIDYNATAIYVNADKRYYAHNHDYQEGLRKTRHKLFYDEIIEVTDGSQTYHISFGRKYRYIYLGG